MPSAAARRVAAVLPPDKVSNCRSLEAKAVARLEGRQGRRAFDELGRGGELDAAAAIHIAGEIGHRRQVIAPGQILAHGDDPGVVGRRRSEPDQMVFLAVELGDLGIAARPALPHRVLLHVEEQGAVAGVFGIDVDLPGEDRGAHDVGRPELQPVAHRDAVRLEHVEDHVAEQRALGVDLRGDDDRRRRRRRQPTCGSTDRAATAAQKSQEFKSNRILYSRLPGGGRDPLRAMGTGLRRYDNLPMAAYR